MNYPSFSLYRFCKLPPQRHNPDVSSKNAATRSATWRMETPQVPGSFWGAGPYVALRIRHTPQTDRPQTRIEWALWRCGGCGGKKQGLRREKMKIPP